MCYIVIWHLHPLWHDHHGKSTNQWSPHKVIAILLIIFCMLHITSLWLIYYITGGLYLSPSFFKSGFVHLAGVLGAPLRCSWSESRRWERRSSRSLWGRTLEHWWAETLERKLPVSAYKSVLWNKLFPINGAISPAILYKSPYMKKADACSDLVCKPLPWNLLVLQRCLLGKLVFTCFRAGCSGDTCEVADTRPQGPSPLLFMLFPSSALVFPPGHSHSFIQKVVTDLLTTEAFY